MCLRRSMYDQDARRAALDSSSDDDQHEPSPACASRPPSYSVVNLEDEQQQEVLTSSSRLARAHERAGRGRAGRASKRRHRGRTVALLVCSRAAQSFVSGPRQLPVVVAIQVFGPFSLSTDGYNLEYNIPRHLPGNAVTRATCRNVKPRNSGFGSKLYRLRDIWANGAW